jgi:TetR/AcrR family transcriptional regulator, cholesterol catabolism regulator
MAPRASARPKRRHRRPIETVVQDKDLVAQRHDEIFRAASRVFISRGYHTATVREIAQEAGLSLGGLYSYIRTKEDILYLVFDKLTTTLRENMRHAIEGIEDPVEQITAALRADLKTTEQYQDEILLMYQETKSLDRASQQAVLSREADYVRFFEDILRAGYERRVFTGHPQLSADIIAYLCSILALRRWNLRTRFSSAEVQDGLIQFVLRALGASNEDGR